MINRIHRNHRGAAVAERFARVGNHVQRHVMSLQPENGRARSGAAPRMQSARIPSTDEGIDQSGKRSGLLPPAGEIKEEPRERLTPVFQHPHQRPACELRSRIFFIQISKTNAICCSMDHQLHIINYQRAVHFACDLKYSGEPTITGVRSGDTRTAIMSFSMYSPK